MIIVGDFNENLSLRVNGTCSKCVNGTCSVCRFSNVLDILALFSVGSFNTHFSQHGRPSQLDLFLTSKPQRFIMFSQFSSGLSCHDLLFGSYKGSFNTLPAKLIIMVRNLKSIIQSDLLFDASNEDYNQIY